MLAAQPGEADVTALPGKYLDLLTEGVDLSNGRSAVVIAVRQVMLSAHRAGIAYTDIYVLLTDVEHRKLAHQVAHGKGGRWLPGLQREVFLRKLWEDTGRLVATRPPWSRADALDAVEFVRDNLEGAQMDPLERSVMTAVLGLASGYGTTQVAAPVRTIAMMTGLGRMQAHRTLERICKTGEWLRLAKHGNSRTGRANLYNVGPGLLDLWGASPPRSQDPPMSHPPMSHIDGEAEMPAPLTIQPADLKGLLQQLEAAGVSLGDLQRAAEGDAGVVVPLTLLPGQGLEVRGADEARLVPLPAGSRPRVGSAGLVVRRGRPAHWVREPQWGMEGGTAGPGAPRSPGGVSVPGARPDGPGGRSGACVAAGDGRGSDGCDHCRDQVVYTQPKGGQLGTKLKAEQLCCVCGQTIPRGFRAYWVDDRRRWRHRTCSVLKAQSARI
jgi:hypothetical protein